jgi:hypothetical protein
LNGLIRRHGSPAAGARKRLSDARSIPDLAAIPTIECADPDGIRISRQKMRQSKKLERFLFPVHLRLL